MARKHARNEYHRKPQTTSSSGTLRIIGGRLGGRPIPYLGDLRTRPMKQRVREAAFNLLGSRVVGMHVIDLFAGTGALAWEALSRGAVSATLIERHFPTARLLRETAVALDVHDQIAIVAGDTFVWARTLVPESLVPEKLPDGQGRAWLVFCSPPYELYVTHLSQLGRLVQTMIDAAPPHSLIVVESDHRFDTGSLPQQYTWDVRDYAPAVLAVGESNEGQGNGST